MIKNSGVIAIACVTLFVAGDAVRAQPHQIPVVFQEIDDRPRLPRVLLLGDSISIGYTLGVRELLDGVANVHRAPENCGPTTKGLERIEAWLGRKKWDVIHFNFGLHDLKYVDEQGRRVTTEQGQLQVAAEQYEQNLTELIKRLKATGARLIWCTTTPVPEGAHGRKAGDAEKYNQIAAQVVRRTLGDDRVVNDLYAFCKPRLAEIQRPADVHFTGPGSQALAEQVAALIRQQLEPEPTEVARGIVFVDRNGNRRFDGGDQPLPNARVSNGREIVVTDSQGRYALDVTSDCTVFVIKPKGYRTPVDDKQLPQFYFTHKPQGSPPGQRFPGVQPTGPLPESIDFPLYSSREPQKFKAILFGDPQPRNVQELDYIAHDVVQELIGTDASFGVTLGDITFDNLALFEPQARMIGILGIPWYNVIGNHDLNFEASRDHESDESFQRVFGPAYYSFNHGPVHFLVLDNVEWLVDEQGAGGYQGGFGKRQLEFVRRDLELIPPDQLVVLLMHIPLTGVRDRQELYRLIEERPFCMSISAHTHTHEHRFITRDDGWHGPKPHHHVVNVTVSGSWWSGAADERGIPHTMMADGAPNGYSILSFDGHRYKLDFKAAGRPADYQMQIHAPNAVVAEQQSTFDVYVNVFNGSSNSDVRLKINQGDAVSMQYVREVDPTFETTEQVERQQLEALKSQGVSAKHTWRGLPRPGRSTHLWRLSVSTADLPQGVNVLEVTARLRDATVKGRRLLRVERS